MSYKALIDKLEKSDQKKNESKDQSDSRRKLEFLEFKEPKIMRFRIFPHKKDPKDVPFEQVFIHLGFEHPNFGSRKALVCKGRDCPLCAFYKKRERGGDDQAWRYKCNQRFIYYVQCEDERGRLKMGLLSLTFYAHEELKKKIVSQLKLDPPVNVFDLKDGRWIEMTMKKIGDKRKYIVAVEGEQDVVTDIEILEWYKTLRPLHQYYKEYSVAELQKIIRGEKLDLGGNKPSGGGSSTTGGKKVDRNVDMKFASDEVESIDDKTSTSPQEEDKGEDDLSNMKRLEDIMSRTEEEDFE